MHGIKLGIGMAREALHSGWTQLALVVASGGIVGWLRSNDLNDIITKTFALITTGMFLFFALAGKFDDWREGRQKRRDEFEDQRRQRFEAINRKSLAAEVKQLKHGQAQLKSQADEARVENQRLRERLDATMDQLAETSGRLAEASEQFHESNRLLAEQRAESDKLRGELAALRGTTKAATAATEKLTTAADSLTNRLAESSSDSIPTVPADIAQAPPP